MDGIKFQKEVEEGKWPHFPRHIKFLDFCLKGSEKFADRKIIDGKYEKCEKNDYDTSKLKEFFNYKENEPIIKTNAWDRLKNKIKKNHQLLLPEVTSQITINDPIYATTRNMGEKEELNPWDLRKYDNNVIEDKPNKQHKTREKEEQER